VPLLTPLTKEQKMQLVDAFIEEVIEGRCDWYGNTLKGYD
jgi:hypothetical protein